MTLDNALTIIDMFPNPQVLDVEFSDAEYIEYAKEVFVNHANEVMDIIFDLENEVDNLEDAISELEYELAKTWDGEE